jgi:hypothetical protein
MGRWTTSPSVMGKSGARPVAMASRSTVKCCCSPPRQRALHGDVLAVRGEEVPACGRHGAGHREPARHRIRAGLVHPAVHQHAAGRNDRHHVARHRHGIERVRLSAAILREHLEIEADGNAAALSVRRCELDQAAGILVRPPGSPDQVGDGRAGARERVEPGPLHAAHHRHRAAAVLGDLHADVRTQQDAPRDQSPGDLGLELGRREPGGVHAAQERQGDVPVGGDPQALLEDGGLGDCRHRRTVVLRMGRVGGLRAEQLRDADVEQVVGADAIAVPALPRARRGELGERVAIARAHEIAGARRAAGRLGEVEVAADAARAASGDEHRRQHERPRARGRESPIHVVTPPRSGRRVPRARREGLAARLSPRVLLGQPGAARSLHRRRGSMDRGRTVLRLYRRHLPVRTGRLRRLHVLRRRRGRQAESRRQDGGQRRAPYPRASRGCVHAQSPLGLRRRSVPAPNSVIERQRSGRSASATRNRRNTSQRR